MHAPTGGTLEKLAPHSTAHARQHPNTDTVILGGRRDRSAARDSGCSTFGGSSGSTPPVGRLGRVARTCHQSVLKLGGVLVNGYVDIYFAR